MATWWVRIIALCVGGAVVLLIAGIFYAVWAYASGKSEDNFPLWQRILEPHRFIPVLKWIPSPLDALRLFGWARS
jgi:hypothetical protein